ECKHGPCVEAPTDEIGRLPVRAHQIERRSEQSLNLDPFGLALKEPAFFARFEDSQSCDTEPEHEVALVDATRIVAMVLEAARNVVARAYVADDAVLVGERVDGAVALRAEHDARRRAALRLRAGRLPAFAAFEHVALLPRLTAIISYARKILKLFFAGRNVHWGPRHGLGSHTGGPGGPGPRAEGRSASPAI